MSQRDLKLLETSVSLLTLMQVKQRLLNVFFIMVV